MLMTKNNVFTEGDGRAIEECAPISSKKKWVVLTARRRSGRTGFFRAE